ncbi:6-bladed beta-propeller [Gracilimonas sp.]|uniref:6-bladed beta-propeller n=1 Tax=Gracilimonas sp. TaxID=1974203 RepID=UPI003BAC97CA
MVYRVLYLLLFSFLISCSQSENQQPGELIFNASLEKVVEMKSLEENEDSWIVRPRNVTVDNEDRVYVLDQKMNIIQQFNQEGNFIRSIGKEGRGPGEFDDLYNIYADSVLLGHSRATQTINKFAMNGSFQASFPVQGVSGSTKMFRVGEQFIFFHMNFNAELEDFYGLHIYNQQFEQVGEAQLHASEIYPDFNKELSYQIFADFANIHFIDDTRFLIAPTTYSGQLFEYTLNPQSGKWEQKRPITGVNIDLAYERLSDRQGADMLFFSQELNEPMAFRIHGKSLFLTQLSNGRFVHFVQRDEGKERQYGIELYDEDLNYMGYSVLKSDPDYTDDERITLYPPRAKDSKGRFYSINFSGEGISIEGHKLVIKEGTAGGE